MVTFKVAILKDFLINTEVARVCGSFEAAFISLISKLSESNPDIYDSNRELKKILL